MSYKKEINKSILLDSIYEIERTSSNTYFSPITTHTKDVRDPNLSNEVTQRAIEIVYPKDTMIPPDNVTYVSKNTRYQLVAFRNVHVGEVNIPALSYSYAKYHISGVIAHVIHLQIASSP